MTAFQMHFIRDTMNERAIADVRSAAQQALAPLLASGGIKPGARVAITAGSRGISRIPEILRGVVDAVRDAGGSPFLFPAMGSHGGGTAPGQVAMLEHLGITEASVGAPIEATMDVVDVAKSDRVHAMCDAIAARADAIVVVARVKPHTDFNGTIESGLLKMLAIGMGKAKGAALHHAAFARYGYETIIREAAAMQLANLPVVAGVQIVEDHRGNTNTIEAHRPEEFVASEERLLERAKSLLSRLPFPELDLLIVDEMGKIYSGTGMDTNVTNRAVDGRSQKLASPLIREIYVRDLAEASGGNAIGVGLADFCTRRLADAIDWHATYLNALTAAQPAAARLPVVCDNDRFAVENALNALGISDPSDARVARIANTLHIEAMLATESAIDTLADHDRYRVEAETVALDYDANGNFTPAVALAAAAH